jgi:hypothetical protein
MTFQERQQRNAEIAVMLGYINTTPTDKDFNIYEHSSKQKVGALPKMMESRSMLFDSDWNWLMLVVDKIQELYDSDDLFGADISITSIGAYIYLHNKYELFKHTINYRTDPIKRKDVIIWCLYDFLTWYYKKENNELH